LPRNRTAASCGSPLRTIGAASSSSTFWLGFSVCHTLAGCGARKREPGRARQLLLFCVSEKWRVDKGECATNSDIVVLQMVVSSFPGRKYGCDVGCSIPMATPGFFTRSTCILLLLLLLLLLLNLFPAAHPAPRIPIVHAQRPGHLVVPACARKNPTRK